LDGRRERVLLDYVRNEVVLRLDRGADLSEVQRELIEAAPGLSEDERAGLWLFAWSYHAVGRRGADR
jgi:hypothetical protein